MAQTIEARKSATGGYCFRLFSTYSDEYVTDVLTESQLKEILLQQAMEEFELEFQQRVERAKNKGTSSLIGRAKSLRARW